ncbi:MAG: hypothetical protein PHQ98_04250 [Candidatus ainarchaeum sp.]|nr:hypothetical protein [Candidatus ainarchaeum sp.]
MEKNRLKNTKKMLTPSQRKVAEARRRLTRAVGITTLTAVTLMGEGKLTARRTVPQETRQITMADEIANSINQSEIGNNYQSAMSMVNVIQKAVKVSPKGQKQMMVSAISEFNRGVGKLNLNKMSDN